MSELTATALSKPTPTGSAAFLKALGTAVIALAVSATVLIFSYTQLSPDLNLHRDAASQTDITPRVFTGRNLVLRRGSGVTRSDKSLSLSALADDGSGGRALLTRKTQLLAADYPMVEVSLANHHSGEIFYLIWRTADQPEQIHKHLSSKPYDSLVTICTKLSSKATLKSSGDALQPNSPPVS